MRTITVVGASLAGLHAARALRTQGFDGRLVIVGDEPYRPYDRPPLSKEFLVAEEYSQVAEAVRTGGAAPGVSGSTATADHPPPPGAAATRGPALAGAGPPAAAGLGALALLDAEEESELDAEWLLGVRAEGLDTAGRAVRLADGRDLATDGVVIATGATPRALAGPAPPGVHTLRTLEDAVRLRAELRSGAGRVAVVGGGFVGAEVASSCATLGLDVTVVEAAPLPLVPQLGEAMARVCAGLHADHGVTLVCGTGVAGLHGTDRVTGVELSDGRVVPADVVVVGIGVRPATRWLAGSGLPVDDGVRCDEGCVTALPNVVAVGDVARLGGPTGSVRAEHWTSAMLQGAVAARNLLAGSTVERYDALPYFWSEQYGSRIQCAGHPLPTDVVRVVEGSTEDRDFLAVYERDGHQVAALALNRPRAFTRLRRQLARAQRPSTGAGLAQAGVPS